MATCLGYTYGDIDRLEELIEEKIGRRNGEANTGAAAIYRVNRPFRSTPLIEIFFVFCE